MQSWIHVLEWRATCDADRPALRDGSVDLTYGALLARVESAAGGWHDLGVRSGDRVAVLGHNSAEYLVQVFALMRLGAVPLLLNWRLTGPEVERLIDLADPTAVLTDADCADLLPDGRDLVVTLRPDADAPADAPVAATLDGAPPPRPVDRLVRSGTAFVIHTSGTTGDPKLIPVAHGPLIGSLSGFALDIGDQVAGSRHLVMMPLFHLAGFAQAMQCVLTGGLLVVHDGVDIDHVIDTIESDRIEFFTAAPTIIEMLVDALEGPRAGADVASLREVQYGAASIEPDLLVRAVAAVTPRFRQIYGSTELQGFLSILRPEDHVPGSDTLATAGQIALGWEARVVDPQDEELPPGNPGELQVRGEGLFAGYLDAPDHTAAAFTADGWYRTGDLATLDERRYLRIVGRTKDMIVSGGENVYPAEIERALAAHPAVVECAVVGRPDARWGETPVAYVVAAPGTDLTPHALRDHCRARLAGFKCPSAYVLIDALPRNAVGKIVKTALRTLPVASDDAEPRPAP